MMMHDEKKALMTIMRKRSEAGAPAMSAPMKQESVKSEDGEPDGRHAAAQDMMSAFHEKSAEKLMEAMINFHELHAQDRLRSYDKKMSDKEASEA